MWIFCCGMYRSASTLQFQITTRLVKDTCTGQAIGWIDANRFSEVRDAYADQEGFKVIKVHRCTNSIASEFTQGNALGIYTFRDIRDVYASYMKQRVKPFDYLWREGFVESCLANYQRWTRLPNVLVSKYENITTNLAEEVYRIAQHLGLSIEAEQYEAIAADYSVEIQQQRISQFRHRLLQMQLASNDHREIVDYHDEESLLHMNHIHSGKNGSWIENLSVEEADLISDRVKNWCAETNYSPSTFLR